MIQTKHIMGMPITVEIPDAWDEKIFQEVFSYFRSVDRRFSTYKRTSEISRFNRKEITREQFSQEMEEVFQLAEKTANETEGYFQIEHHGYTDPSGIVKGWAIFNAAQLLRAEGYKNFYINAGGDVEMSGKNEEGKDWVVGIRKPFDPDKIVKVLKLTNCGVATSGNYLRGEHIYDPHTAKNLSEIVSVTVIASDVLGADRFATAVYAMGEKGIYFLEKLSGFEGYMINQKGQATFTTGFEKFVKRDEIHVQNSLC